MKVIFNTLLQEKLKHYYWLYIISLLFFSWFSIISSYAQHTPQNAMIKHEEHRILDSLHKSNPGISREEVRSMMREYLLKQKEVRRNELKKEELYIIDSLLKNNPDISAEEIIKIKREHRRHNYSNSNSRFPERKELKHSLNKDSDEALLQLPTAPIDNLLTAWHYEDKNSDIDNYVFTDAHNPTYLPLFTEGQVPDAIEHAALVALYNATGGANWKNKTNWLQGSTSADLNTWYGVEVVNGDVNKITLFYNNLNGGLPEEIGNLTKLELLDISTNNIGQLPIGIGSLINLKELDLTNCKLNSLPSSLGSLISLEKLSIAYNNINDLPSTIGSLSSLIYLNLYYNNISSLTAEINNITTLQFLNLSRNKLNGLPSQFENLSNLKSLQLDQNLFINFPISINNLTNLQSLNLSDNQISTLPSQIEYLINLEILDLADNQISSLPSQIGSLINLHDLDLSGNQLTDLPNQIGSLANLQDLDLSYNQLTKLPSQVGSLSNLEYLIITNNNLTILPFEIGGLNNLQYLECASNQLTWLPSSIGMLSNVWGLDFTDNKLNSIPAEINNLSNLEYFWLYFNHISTLPASIGSLPMLSELMLDYNNLTTLPNSIGNLDNLTYLEVEFNKLISIPSTIGNLNNLQGLYLYDNQLTSLPIEINNTNLKYFWVHENQINLNYIAQYFTAPGIFPFQSFAYSSQNPVETSIQILANGALTITGSIFTHSQTNYQWQKLINGVWENIIGETRNELIFTQFTLANEGSYRIHITNNWVSNTEQFINFKVEVIESDGNNLVLIDEVLEEGITNPSVIPSLPKEEKNSYYQYIDGLGRPIQEVNWQITPSGEDIITPIQYDNLGRQSTQYLPYVHSSTQGDYHSSYALEQSMFYSTSGNKVIEDNAPFAVTKFEPSPLNRVIKQGAPGTNYQPDNINGKGWIEYSYHTNQENEVLKWEYNETSGTISSTSFYVFDQSNQEGLLFVTQTKDENGNLMLEYKNKQDQVVAKKVQASANEFLFTYYVYDDYNNLRCVIPPKASAGLPVSGSTTLSSETLSQLCFVYDYDERNRMISKQVPGAEPVKMIYDHWDRLVLTQDGNQRTDPKTKTAKNQWSYTKYDAFNRPIITGLWTSENTEANLRSVAMATSNQHHEEVGTALHNYTNQTFPTGIDANQVLSVTYYDNYNFLTDTNWDNEASDYAFSGNHLSSIKGQVTGSKVQVLGSDQYLKSVSYYDDRYRLVHNITENLANGQDIVTNTYDFRGKVVKSEHNHQGYQGILTHKRYEYDHAERLTNVFHQVGNFSPIELTDVDNLSLQGNKLIKTAASGWGTGGAASVQTLDAGENGYVEVIATETNTGKMFGFSASNTDAHYNTIDFALNQNGTGQLVAYENGISSGALGEYQPGDVLAIERKDNQILYKKNGVVLHTSSQSSTSSLLVDLALNHQNSTLSLPILVKGGVAPEEVVLSAYEYNALGELVDKKLHSANGSTFEQSIDYRYNIRGWLTHINNSELANDGFTTNDDDNDLFGMELLYEDELTGLTEAPPPPDPDAFLPSTQPTYLARPQDHNSLIEEADQYIKLHGLNQKPEASSRVGPDKLMGLALPQAPDYMSLSAGLDFIVLPEEDPNITSDLGEGVHVDNTTPNLTAPQKLNATDIWLESECADSIGSEWEVLSDSTASNDSFLQVKTGSSNFDTTAVPIEDRITFNFSVDQAGQYKVFTRHLSYDGSDDSFWVQVNGGTWIQPYLGANRGSFTWAQVGGALTFDMQVGTNTIVVAVREQNAKLDKLYITQNGNQPTDKGSTASNCLSAPTPPANLQATAVSSSQVTLSWQDTQAEDGYVLERKVASGSFVYLDSLAADSITYTDTNLSPTTSYTYRILAYNAAGNSGFSSESAVTTPAVPVTPDDIWLESECAESIGSEWEVLSDSTASNDSFLQVKTGSSNFDTTAVPAQDRITFNFSVDQPGQYKVFTRHLSYDGSDDSFWVQVNGGTWIQPFLGANRGSFTWAQVGDTLTFDMQAGTNTIVVAVREQNAKLDKLYITQNGNQPTDKGSTASNCNLSTPNTPTSFTAVAQSTSSVLINWNDVSNESGYILERKVAGGNFTLVDSLAADASSFLDQGLQNATTYTYRILAYNSTGNSSFSSEVSATTESLIVDNRITDSLQVLYRFNEGSGTAVFDVSGSGNAMNLSISDTADITWLPEGGLQINTSTTISTASTAKLFNAAQSSNELTLEAWITPATLNQTGPARIITFSGSSSARNFTLGHDSDASGYFYSARLRTNDAAVNNNGLPDFNQDERYDSLSTQHVVYTRSSSGEESIFVDGVLVESSTKLGTFSNWDNTYSFALANEVGADRHWLGTYHLIAVYNKALSSTEIQQNFQAGYEDSSNLFVTAEAPASNMVDIRWSQVEGATRYNIYRKTNSGLGSLEVGHPATWLASASHSLFATALYGNHLSYKQTFNDEFELLGTVDGSKTSYQDNSVQPNTAYTYRIEPLGEDNGIITPLDDVPVNTPPTSSQAPAEELYAKAISENDVELRWRYDGPSPITFILERINSEGGVTSITTTETEYTDTNLAAATTYTYRIRTQAGDGTLSDYATPQQVTTFSSATPDALNTNSHHRQFNGNIAAVKWKTRGWDTPQEKLYVFDYDKANRLTQAKYGEKSLTGWNQKMGHYDVENLSYDANGNIESLTRFNGQGGRRAIDILRYTYLKDGEIEGNQLKAVFDDSHAKEGFHDGYTGGDDYDYDFNGNLDKDKNKDIIEIKYNILNLPSVIKLTDNRQIRYTYDAAGTKLRKEVEDAEGKITTTDYIGGIQYITLPDGTRNLEHIQHEEGRIKPKEEGGYVYHYDLKDHLGNVRLTFATESETDNYLATMEVEDTDESDAFPNYQERYEANRFKDENYTGTDYIDHTNTATSKYTMHLDGTSNGMIGLAKSFDVKAGDKVHMEVYATYRELSQPGDASAIANIGAALAGALMKTPGSLETAPAIDYVGNDMYGSGPYVPNEDWDITDAPMAFINYIFFDENFVMKEFGADQISVDAKTDDVNSSFDLIELDFVADQKGYLYVFFSNENPQIIDVYFDDFKIDYEHTKVVGEEDFYPFGLTFNQSQDRSLINKYLYNGKELQDELGLGWYDYGARMYDPAIGRWHVVDPMAEKFFSSTPYNYVDGNPIRRIDPNGAEWIETENGWTTTDPEDIATVIAQQGGGNDNSSNQSGEDPLADSRTFIGPRQKPNYYGALQKQLGYPGFMSNMIGQGVVEGIGVVDLYMGARYVKNMYQLWKFSQELKYLELGKSFIWASDPLWRGRTVENIVTINKYLKEGFEFVGGLRNGFFPGIDVFRDGLGVSIKSTQAEGGFRDILSNIQKLSRMTGQNVDGFQINAVRLDIYVPKGYDKNLLRSVTHEAHIHQVPVQIIEF